MNSFRSRSIARRGIGTPRPRGSPPKSNSGVHAGLPASAAAFTLVEIILAIGLATGLLIVALTFYRQAAEMRGQILRESDRVSTMRLVLDRLAGDLRAAQPKASPGNEFTGDSTSMSFIKTAFTSLPPNAPPGASEPTDLVRISLTTLFGTNGNRVVVSGLDRGEVCLNPLASFLALATNSSGATLALGTNLDSLSLSPPDQTNQVTEPFADIVRFVRFRYWDGAAWQMGWTNATPPPGVEIVLSTVGLEEDAEADAYPTDAVRRVVFVPAGMAQSQPPDSSALTNSTPSASTNSATL
jgi:hypothetical protein